MKAGGRTRSSRKGGRLNRSMHDELWIDASFHHPCSGDWTSSPGHVSESR